MTGRPLSALVIGLAAAAAWVAVPWSWGFPLLWIAVLLGVLAAPPARRRMVEPPVVLLGLGLLMLAWVPALDRELLVVIALTWALGMVTFGLARMASPGDRALAVLAVLLAATALVGVAQVTGVIRPDPSALETLPSGFREAAGVRTAGLRASGTARLPGHFAALLIMSAPLLAAAAARAAPVLRRLAAAGLVLAVAGVALSGSLAAVPVAVVLVAAAFVGTRQRRRFIGAVALVLVLGAGIVLARPDLVTLVPVRLRLVNWQTAGQAFLGSPLTGVGPGGMGQAGLASAAGAVNITPYAHNSLVQFLAEFGLAGVGVLTLFLAWLGKLLICGWSAQRPLVLAVLVVLLHNLVDFSLYAVEVLVPWCVLLGVLAARVAPTPARPLPGWILVPVLVAGCLGSTLAWRAETEMKRALVAPADEGVPVALAAARWAPWTLRPLFVAVDRAHEGGVDENKLARLEETLARRWWVRPRSSAWSEARGRLLLLRGRPAEALPWIREARRRAPWRRELHELEEACRPAA